MTSQNSATCDAPSSVSDPAGRNGSDSCRSSSSSSSGMASPNFLKWTDNLDSLLNDPTGLDLFQDYLNLEDKDRYHMLKFWLACRGLHKQPKDKISDCVKVIYSKLFLKIGQGISSDVRKKVAKQVYKAGQQKIPMSTSLFDEASRVVYDVMNNVMYPNFLRSETYLKYAQQMQRVACSADNNNREAPVLSEDDELPKSCSQPLEVVEEDEELSFDFCSLREQGSESLRRILGQKSSSSSSSRISSNCRLHYNSYNPVSRQDSELQSLSSGARTDSQTDLSHFAEDINSVSDTGKTYVEQRLLRHKLKHGKKTEDSFPIHVNDNTDMPNVLPVKPRSMHPAIQHKMRPVNPAEFFNLLLTKLEQVKKERESGELVRKKIKSIDYDRDACGMSQHLYSDSVHNRLEDDDQDILDKHVQRIWSDKTPKRSPGIGTPIRRKSPEARGASSLHSYCSDKSYYPSSVGSSRPSYAYTSCSSNVRRKDKDGHSMFSTDSGNITDPIDYANQALSVSELAHSSHHPSYCSRTWAGSQKTITDSGVSVMTRSMADSYVPSHCSKDRIVVSSWQQERRMPCSSRCARSVVYCNSANCFEKELCSTSSKRKPKSSLGTYKTKGGVPERGSLKNSTQPGQPFFSDPKMPPLPFYRINATDTLEETRRRLQEIPNVHQTTGPQRLESDIPPYTSIVYHFSDEPTPYLLKVPGHRVTLRTFKENMPPKKGNLRFFFETICEEFENKAVLEEINDDDCVLPLLKGKIMAQIKIIK